jgi:hypothetical protein
MDPDPDPGCTKSYGSYISGSGSATLGLIHRISKTKSLGKFTSTVKRLGEELIVLRLQEDFLQGGSASNERRLQLQGGCCLDWINCEKACCLDYINCKKAACFIS